ncbi:MAG: hypothetical protein ACJA04_001017 [Cellvibrionaceae bacterium]|jgi:hypothetical protein
MDLGLEDIITPSSVSGWPPAIGWWMLLCFTIVIVVVSTLAIKRYRRKWIYRKQALALLKKAYQKWQREHNTPRACQAFAAILKQTALSAYDSSGDLPIASLKGDDWIELLNRQVGFVAFTEEQQKAITRYQYQKNIDTDITALYRSIRLWINKHRTTLS